MTLREKTGCQQTRYQAVTLHFEVFIDASVFFLLVFVNTQLDRCQEGDCGRVFEVNLNGQALEQVPDLKEVGIAC